jgi:hypothetical protein
MNETLPNEDRLTLEQVRDKIRSVITDLDALIAAEVER